MNHKLEGKELQYSDCSIARNKDHKKKCEEKIEKLSLQKNSLKKNIDKLMESIATEHLNHDSEQSLSTLKTEEELDEVIEKLEEVLEDMGKMGKWAKWSNICTLFEEIIKIITDEK